MRVNALITSKRPGTLFLRKTGNIYRVNVPPLKTKTRKTPRYHKKTPSPPSIFGVNAPAPSWQVNLSVGNGAVSEAGQGVLHIGNATPGMRVGKCCVQLQQNRQDADKEPNMFYTYCLEKITASQPHSNEYRGIDTIHWGVAFIPNSSR